MTRYTTDYCRNPHQLADLLNKYAARGWECLSVVSYDDDQYLTQMLLAVFRREGAADD